MPPVRLGEGADHRGHHEKAAVADQTEPHELEVRRPHEWRILGRRAPATLAEGVAPHLLRSLERQKAQQRLGSPAAGGLDPHRGDVERPVERVADEGDVVDALVRDLPDVAGQQLVALALALLAAGSGETMATMGLAEWSVHTPGGAIICHMGGWKERHGDCLRSPDGDTVYGARLRRWRYHEGIVSGETEDGYFIFDERTRHVDRFGSERALNEALARRDAGRPLSGWLTAADGWTES